MRVPARIVLCGAPLSGKTTILERYARSKAGRVSFSRAGDATTDPIVATLDVSCGVAVTIPGAVWDVSCWREVLRDASGVLLVLDGQKGLESEGSVYRGMLDTLDLEACPHAAVVTKRDLFRRRAARDEDIIRAGFRLSGWACYVSGTDSDGRESVAALQYVIDAVADGRGGQGGGLGGRG